MGNIPCCCKDDKDIEIKVKDVYCCDHIKSSCCIRTERRHHHHHKNNLCNAQVLGQALQGLTTTHSKVELKLDNL